MNVKALIISLCLAHLFAVPTASAQGFAGLGQTPEGFALPDPATRFDYPAEHGAHPMFRIEWWYVTANLKGSDGADYGVQWTLFRNALRPTGKDSDQAWMAHAAVSAPSGHRFAERFARGGIGQADVTAQPFSAFIDEWHMEGPDLNTVTLTAQGSDFAYDLELNADRPFVVQGTDGFSVKSEVGQASHYYSQPFYQIEGTLSLDDQTIPVTGQGWLDREWSSQPLSETQTGWDWLSLHLDGGNKLMVYRLRDAKGAPYTVGTWTAPDGTPDPLENGEITLEPLREETVAGRDVPVEWAITLPDRDLDITAKALYPQSWMGTLIPYWEGPVTVSGTHQGQGYLEMSGYE